MAENNIKDNVNCEVNVGKETLEDFYKKMHSGHLYDPMNDEILNVQLKYLDDVQEYNRLKHSDLEGRWKKLKSMFAEIGEGSYIEIQFNSNFGARHCYFGKCVYANYNLSLVDDTEIHVGDYTMFGPGVVLATAGHPINPEMREGLNLQFNRPIHIGRNCWLGAGVIVLPGVTIGDNTVIGAGSVVSKDIPANVVAVGSPCKVMREISERDREYYYKDLAIPKSFFELVKARKDNDSDNE